MNKTTRDANKINSIPWDEPMSPQPYMNKKKTLVKEQKPSNLNNEFKVKPVMGGTP